MTRYRIAPLAPLLGGLALALTAPAAPAAEDGVTFFVTSDSHCASFRNVDRNDRNKATIERMNALPGTAWPDKFGADQTCTRPTSGTRRSGTRCRGTTHRARSRA